MMDRIRYLTCREVIAWTTEWTEGSLSGDRLTLFEAHLEECESCRTFAYQIELTAEFTMSWTSSDTVEAGRKEDVLELFLESPLRHEGDDPVASEASSAESDVSSSPPLDGYPCPELDESTARAYLEDRLPARQQIAVLEHLIDGCEPCRLTCSEIALPELAGEVQSRVSMREEPPAPELEARYLAEFERLVSRQHECGNPRVRDDLEPQRFLLWLIRQGRDLTESDPPKALVVASLGVSLAEDLDIESRVRAAMLKGMVIRKVEGDYTRADRWFSWALDQTDECQELSFLKPKILSLWGFSKWCRSQTNDALEFYQTALQIYRTKGDAARWAECVIEMSAPLQEVAPREGVRKLLQSSCVVDCQGSARLAMVLTQYLSYCYLVLGTPRRALIALEASRGHLQRFEAGRSVRLRIDWTEASILNALGFYDEGARRLREIRREFLRLDLVANAAFVSLDLAVSLIGMSSWKELAAVAESMATFFISRGISGEAAVALGLFRRAVAANKVTVAQVELLRRRLVWEC